jgi:nocardicin N-oxygenase
VSALPRFPFRHGPDVRPPGEYRGLLAAGALPRVTLPDGSEALLALTYADVRVVLSDARFSRAAFTGANLFARARRSLALVTSDPPEHTRRRAAIAHAFGFSRAAIAHAFGAGRVRRSRAKLAELAGRLLGEMAAGGRTGDLVGGFTLPLSVRVVCDMLGVPTRDGALLKPWVDAMMSTSRYTRERVADSHQRMHDYFAALVEAKRAELERGRPGDDLLTELIVRTDPEKRLDADEVVVMGAGLLMAGYETTSNALASCAFLLLRERELAACLRRDPRRIPAAVEEMLRFIPVIATGGIPHVALADVRLGDTVVRAGEVVVPVAEAANRDPVAFLEPDLLAVGASRRPHLAFGYGRHHCPGAPLARAELRVGIGELLRRFPTLELAVPEEELGWREGMFIRGPWALPVRWGPDAT